VIEDAADRADISLPGAGDRGGPRSSGVRVALAVWLLSLINR
jgi:hypothetical protein